MGNNDLFIKKTSYIPELDGLLLLADPDKNMAAKYINDGDIFVLYKSGEIIAECVVVKQSDSEYELKNIAVREDFQNKGFGSRLLEHIFDVYSKKCSYLIVGTSESGIGFYEKFGFTLYSKRENFFKDNYSEPVYENGRLCEHMYMLKKIFTADKTAK